jgi:chromosome segregation ATPase
MQEVIQKAHTASKAELQEAQQARASLQAQVEKLSRVSATGAVGALHLPTSTEQVQGDLQAVRENSCKMQGHHEREVAGLQRQLEDSRQALQAANALVEQLQNAARHVQRSSGTVKSDNSEGRVAELDVREAELVAEREAALGQVSALRYKIAELAHELKDRRQLTSLRFSEPGGGISFSGLGDKCIMGSEPAAVGVQDSELGIRPRSNTQQGMCSASCQDGKVNSGPGTLCSSNEASKPQSTVLQVDGRSENGAMHLQAGRGPATTAQIRQLQAELATMRMRAESAEAAVSERDKARAILRAQLAEMACDSTQEVLTQAHTENESLLQRLRAECAANEALREAQADLQVTVVALKRRMELLQAQSRQLEYSRSLVGSASGIAPRASVGHVAAKPLMRQEKQVQADLPCNCNAEAWLIATNLELQQTSELLDAAVRRQAELEQELAEKCVLLGECHSHMEKLKEELECRNKDLVQAGQRVGILTQNLVEATSEGESIGQRIRELERDVAHKCSSLQASQEDLQALKQDLENAHASLEAARAERQTLQQDVDRQTSKLGTSMQTVTELEEELRKASLQATAAKERLEHLEQDLTARNLLLEGTSKRAKGLEEALAAAELGRAAEAQNGRIKLDALQQQLTAAETQLSAQQAAPGGQLHVCCTERGPQVDCATHINLQEELKQEKEARLKAETAAADAGKQAKAQASAWRQSLHGLKEDQAEMLRQWTAASTAWEVERQYLEAEIAHLEARVKELASN